MMTNLAECINFVLEGVHYLTITLIVKETYFHLSALFPKWTAAYVGQIVGNHVWCKDVMKEIRQNIARAKTMNVVCHSHQNMEFWVTEYTRLDQDMLGASYCVHLT
ncbi:hypothetical protein PVK06_009108 [Gossypium arboreum]|uniref:Uncharacterized protein n=1 Tax=Gossypium arboreum TaxID=29729 RepID=A0ABR0QLL7_GOSAR|nr:hypothetical protein PVK06_009108 [Gossypium arboreum]